MQWRNISNGSVVPNREKHFLLKANRNSSLVHHLVKYLCSMFASHVLILLFIAILAITDYKWFLDGRAIDMVYFGVREDCHTLHVGLNENCSDVEVFQYSSFEDKGEVINVRL